MVSKSKPRAKLVSLIFPNYNGKDLALDFLESLKKTSYPNFEIIIIDNASADGSIEAIKKKFPHVKIVQNEENVGLTRAYNQGINASKGDYVLMLDNDMVAHEPDWITELVKTAESDGKIGSVLPMRISYHNRDIIETKAGFRQTIENYEKMKVTKFIYRVLGAPMFVTGVSLIKRKVLDEVGLFDEEVFGAFGDVEMHYRIVQAGYKDVYEPKSKILHKGSSTWLTKSYSREYHHCKERIRFILTKYPTALRPITLTINLVFLTCLIPYYAIRGRFDLSRAIRDGIVWNIKNWRDYI
jgi:GT2 family glycosyltransferase